MLPLMIPVLFTPAMHLLFPQLEHLALIRLLEKALPWLETLGSYERHTTPWLVVVSILFLSRNLALGLAVTFLERRRSRSAIPSSALLGCENQLEYLAGKFGLPRPILSVSSRHPLTATSFGWCRPIISLGREWIEWLDPEEMEAVLAHELAHHRQGDHWQILIARTCRDLLFFNPLAHYIFNQLCQAREEAADDLAWQITGKPLALASSLVKFWRLQQPRLLKVNEMGFAGQPKHLEKRIRRLIEPVDEHLPIPLGDRIFYGISIALTLVFSLV